MKVNKVKRAIIAAFAAVFAFVAPTFAAEGNVAKVGSTEYATIDEAIANWKNNTTLTLLADVTLSDVIKINSNESRTLDLGTYTMTAAKNKDAFQYVVKGCTSDVGLSIKADATNPGGITASGKAIIRHTKPLLNAPSKDRPYTQFFGGVFNASYIVYQGSNTGLTTGYTGASAPRFVFHGGTFNGTIYSNRSKNIFYGGTFNGNLQMSVDTSADALIAGGKFKFLSNLFGSALNTDKFTIGSAAGVYDRGIYVDKDGYYVITPAPITAVSAKYPAVKKESYDSNNYFYYSAAATYGMFYEVASMAGTGINVELYTPKVSVGENVTVPDGVSGNLAVEEYNVVIPDGVNNVAITVTSVEGSEKVVFNVEPKDADGDKVSTPASAITFRLPVPAAWAGFAKVSHDGKGMGVYEIKEENGDKYVEVSSAKFSEFAVELAEVELPGDDDKVASDAFGANTVFDGTTYYETLQKAVEAVCGTAGATLYCKPGADVGSLQHAPVTATLTIYGNGAYVSGGSERDFDIGNTDPSGGKDITADMTLTVKDLEGCGAWGAKATAHTVNLVFEDCQNMGKVFITGWTGTLNITIKDSAFEGVIKEALYSNADGAITLNNVDFSNLTKAVNLNHKATGTQTVTIDGCDFVNCGANVAADEIPVRVLSSVKGGKSTLTVSGTTFSGTPTNGADILLDYGLGETTASVTTTTANVTVEKEKNVVGITTKVTSSTEAINFTNVLPAAKIGDVEYATLDDAVAAVADNTETKIALIKDVTLSSKLNIPANKAVVLDLNGKVLTCGSDGYCIANEAGSTVTIKDSVGTGVVNGVVYNGNGTMIIDGGTYNAIGSYAILNCAATMTINGGVINGKDSYPIYSYNEGHKLTINNVTVNGECGCINAYYAGEVIINDGTFNFTGREGYTYHIVYVSTGTTMTINGGTFKKVGDVDVNGEGGGGVCVNGTGKLIVTGGTFDGAISDIDNYSANTVIKISGGTFSDASAKNYVDDGFELKQNADGTYGVKQKPVAKVGNTEYATIDEAIAAWGNNSTLTLLNNVTLSDVVTLKSTEHHILDLGTYTVTAADGKNAIEIVATAPGTGDAERYAITVKADATNPGGINAGSKSIIYYDYSKGTATGNDRPIIKIEGGVFTGSTSSFGTAGIYTKGSAARKCATLNISGGIFNCSINGQGKSKLLISGGTFNYSVGSQGDSTALRLISGGTFKTLGFMTADSNNTKFWFGTSMGNSNVGVYVDDNGYIVVGGAPVTEPGNYEASASYSGASSLLQYSSAKNNGLYYTSVKEALADNNKTTGSVTVYVAELDMSGISYLGTIVAANADMTIKNAPEGLKVVDTNGNELLISEDGSLYNPVAQIGTVKYQTLAAALAAAQDGDTVELLWAEGNAPIAMNGSVFGKSVTITGSATVDWSKGFLFVGRGGEGDGTVIFDNANLESASNNASYGIHVSGREKNTNNKYDGTVVINNSTIVLDYLIDKGAMTLNNSTLTVKNGFAVGGRPASETESGVDATATIGLSNGSKLVVNNHNGMGLGFEALGVMNIDDTSSFECTQSFLVTAKGTMNVNGGDLKVAGTLTNKGTINVTDTDLVDMIVDGPVNAFGTVNISGTSKVAGVLSAGYNGSPDEQVVVNITGNFESGNVLVGSAHESKLNINSATAYFGQLGAFGDVEINNSTITYGYAFIRNDFTATNSSLVQTNGVNTYISGNAKVVLDNSQWTMGAYSNIGSYGGYMYGNADVTLKNGSSMTAGNLGIEVQDGKNVKVTLEDSSSLTATTKLTNQGTIVLASVDAKINANECGNVVTDIADHKVVFENGQYKIVEKVYVAQIGENKFESLQAAIDAVQEGETVTLLADVDVTTPAYGQNALNYARAVNFTLDLNGKTLTANTGNSVFRFNITKSGATSDVAITIKNGKVVAGSNTWCALMAAGISADVKAVMNLENLTVECSKAGDLGIKAWDYALVSASNVTVNATNGAGGFYAVGGEIVLNDCTVNQKGLYTAPYLSMAFAVSSKGKMTVNSGTYSAEPTAAAEGNNQGTSHGSWVGGVMNSGGTLIINGGTFSNDNFGDNNLATSARGLILGDTASVIRVNDGTFNALKTIFDYQNNLGVQPNPDIMIAGGVYSADPMVETSYGAVSLADGYAALPNLNDQYVVGVKPTATVNSFGATTVPAGNYGVWNGSSYTGTSMEDMPLSFVMQFLANQTAADMATSPFADWYGDFVITFTGIKNDSFIADGCYLAGYYGDFGWVKIPVDGMKIEEGARYPVMLGVGLGQKYDYICSGVQNFKCAMFITPEILEANPDLEVKLELAVVDNSKGSGAAASALVNNEKIMNVVDYTYDVDDFVVNYVAQIGETKFTSLQAAFDAAVDGDTITVVADVTLTEPLTIPEGKTITLDLNGKTINGAFNGLSTTNHIYALNNYGTLTITDTSAEKDGAINSRGIYNYGSLTLNAGKIAAIDGNGGYAVNNESGSTFVMNGGWIAADYEDGDAPEAGNYDATALDVPAGCTATLNGGKITNAGNFTFAIAAAGTLNIPETSTITVEGRHGAIAVSGGTTTINAGTFTIPANTENTDNVLYVSGGALIINGGTFTGDSDTASGGSCLCDAVGTAMINGGIFSGSSGGDVWGKTGTTIKGGTFENLTETKYIADGYAALPNLNDQYVVGVKPTATVNSFGATTVPAGEYGVWNGSSYTSTSKEDMPMPLSFVMQFLADQTAADMATSPFADWYGDFVITFTGINNDSFIADGCYLAGYYGDFGWVKIPVDGMKIEEGVRYPVMLGVGLGQKYDYICSSVEDFKCAMFLTPEILAANPNLKVKLELAVVDNSQGSDSAASALVNNDKVFSVTEYEYGAEAFAPALPTATVTSIDAPEGTPLTFALNFKADDVTDAQLAYYRDWYADFVLTITGLPEEGVTFNTDGTADGYLAGQYDAWSENWVSVPFEDVTLRNGESIKIMEYAATLMGQSGLKLTYNDVYSFVKNFDCGVYFTPEFLAANPDMKVSLSLRMYKTGDATDEGIAIGEMEEFSAPTVVAKIGSTPYATLEAAIAAAGADDTVTILKNVGTDAAIQVAKKVTIDLNGKTIAATENDKVGDGVFCVVAGGDLTINDSVGTGVINGVGDNDYNIAVWANGGKVTINGGNFTNVGATDNTDPNAHFDLIYVKNGGEVVINGGTFECETPAFTLNSHDTYKGVITVNGGTFVGFDPRNNAAETSGTTFMAAGKYTFAEGGNYIVVTPEDYILNGVASDSATVGDIDSLLAGAVTVTKDGEKYVATATYTFKVTVVDTVNPEKSSYELTGGKLRPGKTVAVKYIDLATGAESWVKPESDTVTFKLVIK